MTAASNYSSCKREDGDDGENENENDDHYCRDHRNGLRVSIACNVSKEGGDEGNDGDNMNGGGGCGRDITGWANVSRDRSAFHRLHDHGTEEWAIVVYLADGEGGRAGRERGEREET